MRPRDGERTQHVGDVVAAALDHVPVERAPFLGQRLDPHDVFDVAVDLLVVVVDDAAEMVEPVMGGEHRRLPDLTLLLLPVAHHAIDPARMVVDARRHGDAAAHRESLPERAGRDLDAGRVMCRRMTLRVAVEGAELHQVAQRKVAALRHQRIDHRRDMADREMPVIAARG